MTKPSGMHGLMLPCDTEVAPRGNIGWRTHECTVDELIAYYDKTMKAQGWLYSPALSAEPGSAGAFGGYVFNHNYCRPGTRPAVNFNELVGPTGDNPADPMHTHDSQIAIIDNPPERSCP